jgi:uncharacterized membrane protein YdjX (TVP38/TMEM64 family)
MTEGARPARRLTLFIGGAFLCVLAYVAFRFAALDADAVFELFASPWGPVVYVLLFSALEPFGVAGLVFITPGSLVWDWQLLFLYSWLGSIGAGIVGFSFARTIGRDWAAQRIPQRLRRFDDRLAENALRGVIFVRLVTFLFPPAHWLLGLSRVDFASFVAGTAIGMAPAMAVLTWFVSEVSNLVVEQAAPPWLFAILVVFVIVVIVWFRRRGAASEPGG